jgi:hypothetical protein
LAFAIDDHFCFLRKVSGETAGPNGLNEGYANPLLVPTCDVSWAFYAVAFDDENKIIGDSEGAGDFKARAGKGHIANLAANYATLIERDGPCFQDTASQRLSVLWGGHQAKRSALSP